MPVLVFINLFLHYSINNITTKKGLQNKRFIYSKAYSTRMEDINAVEVTQNVLEYLINLANTKHSDEEIKELQKDCNTGFIKLSDAVKLYQNCYENHPDKLSECEQIVNTAKRELIDESLETITNNQILRIENKQSVFDVCRIKNSDYFVSKEGIIFSNKNGFKPVLISSSVYEKLKEAEPISKSVIYNEYKITRDPSIYDPYLIYSNPIITTHEEEHEVSVVKLSEEVYINPESLAFYTKSKDKLKFCNRIKNEEIPKLVDSGLFTESNENQRIFDTYNNLLEFVESAYPVEAGKEISDFIKKTYENHIKGQPCNWAEFDKLMDKYQ